MSEILADSPSKLVIDSHDKIRVLHVDDDQGLLTVAKQCLEIEPRICVDTASSAEEALDKLEKERYDVIVSDYQMPIKDGLELLKELKEKGDATPFIIFTGKGREEVAIKALNLGADQYLNKTGDPETVYYELAHAISVVAERRKAKEEKIFAETALKKCGERYEHLFNSAIDGIIIAGPDGRISSLNPTLARMLGYDAPKELIGKQVIELYAQPEARSQMLKELATEGSLRDYELVWKKRDGTLIDIQGSFTVDKDEKGSVRIEAILKDVTEKKKIEQALVESEQKLRSVVQGSPIPAFYINKDHTVVYWKSALEKYTHLKAENVIGTDGHMTAFYPHKRCCLADLLVDGETGRISLEYAGKFKKSELVEGGYEATDFRLSERAARGCNLPPLR
jgi:PAS domain S-box-containing protein